MRNNLSHMPSSHHGFSRGGWFVLACIIYATATLLVLAPACFDGRSMVLSKLGEDLSGQFIGWRAFGFGQLRHGHLALWNPHLFSGTPFLGGFQSALLYPPNWLFLVLPLATAINASIGLHVLLAGIATYLWAEYRRLNPISALLSGLIFMFGGAFFLHIYPGHLSNLCTMAWAPLIFLSIDRLTCEKSWNGVWVGSIAVAMQVLAGHPQYVLYTAVVAAIYASARLRGAPRRRQAVAGFVLIYVAGAALSAAQLLTGLQATAESARSHLSPATAGTQSWAPESLLTAVMPGFFGDMNPTVYWGRWYLWEQSIYVGVAATALALYGLGRETAAMRRGAVAAAAVTLLLALGRYTPLFHVICHLPGFSSFRGLSKFVFLLSMFIALLAGVGFDRLMRTTKVSRVAPIVAGTMGAMALVFAAVMSHEAQAPRGWWVQWLHDLQWTGGDRLFKASVDPSNFPLFATNSARELAWCGMILLLVAAIWWIARHRRPAAYLLPVLAAAELLTFASRNTVSFSMQSVDREAQVLREVIAGMGPGSRVLARAGGLMLLARGNDMWGDDPMVIGRYAQFIARSQRRALDDPLFLSFAHLDSPMLRLARMQYYFDEDNRPIRALNPPLPRALLIGRCRIIPEAGRRLEALADQGFDPSRTVILETSPEPAPVEGAVAGQVDLADRSTDQIEVHASLSHPAILLITDTYSTGWHIRPLEAPAPQHYQVLPADHAFRGVPLAAGQHHFLLEYRPTAWIVGKWISIAALATYVLLGLLEHAQLRCISRSNLFGLRPLRRFAKVRHP